MQKGINNMKIACQTITFGGERHKTDLKGIIKAVADAGYDGMENGFGRFNASEMDNYKNWLIEANLKMAGIHIGGDFNDEESVQKQHENIPALIQFAQTLECRNIFFSGSPKNHSADAYKAVAENLNKLGKTLSGDGLVLSYHNHDWEIKGDCLGMYTLCDNTAPEYLSFVPDIGWVVRGSGKPLEVLKRLGKRVSNLHFKEFTSDGSFTELGKGIVNFKEVYDYAKGSDILDMWIVAEQDASSIGAEESIKQNFEYIKGLM
jgi:sugar phosphate isomerase/epimerase